MTSRSVFLFSRYGLVYLVLGLVSLVLVRLADTTTPVCVVLSGGSPSRVPAKVVFYNIPAGTNLPIVSFLLVSCSE